MKKFILRFLPVVDMILTPFVYPSAWLLKKIRLLGVHRLPKCKNVLLKIGVFPISDNYYEPIFDYNKEKIKKSNDRNLLGINWNTNEQLRLLNTLTYSSELLDIPQNKNNTSDFYLFNGKFESGDTEFWYQLIRYLKPRRIFEIGSGNSTLIAIRAIKKNQTLDPYYECNHVCIEPYEMPWLEQKDVSVIREKVENVEIDFFSKLEENDILFIDSSHIIRPHGDVLFEYLELLPSLNKGVIVHLHDIFSPKNYPKKWLEDEVKFWNEQYLLEAFMSNNSDWKIIGALNYLYHNHYEHLKSVSPFLTPDKEPGSFYIKKLSKAYKNR